MKRNLLFIPAAAAAITMCACGPDTSGEKAEAIYLSASPAWLGFDASDASGNVITVKSNSAWTASADEGLTIDKTSGPAGEHSVRVTSAEGGETLVVTFTTTLKNSNGKAVSKTVNVTNGGGSTDPDPIDPDSYWYKAADLATTELLNRYWPPLLSRVTARDDVAANWHFAQRHDYKADPNSNYWQQAHAMDAVVDAYNRTPSTAEFATRKALLLSIFDKWFEGVPKKQWMGNENWRASKWTAAYPGVKTGNAGGWRNEYIDDMEWMVLAQIRMYEALSTYEPVLAAKYLAKAREIYDDYIWGWAWDAADKGMYWRMDVNAGVPQTTSKNACSNGPAMVIAAKLAYHSTDPGDKSRYLAQAKEIYDWMILRLWKDTGAIADKWTGTASSGGALNYNQGTFIGGSHWLYKLTGERKYLESAVKAVDFTINNQQLTADDGTKLLHSHCVNDPDNGNNSVFRAVFLRYFAPMINEPAVDDIAFGKRTGWAWNLKNWADYVWTRGMSIDRGDGTTAGGMLFSYDWRVMHPAANVSDPGVHLGNQISGAVLIESMNLIDAD